MSNRPLLASTSLALMLLGALTAGPGLAKQTARPSSTTVTLDDVRVCKGLSGSSPQEQIPACTKIINSGKIHHPHEGDYYATRGAAYYTSKQYYAALADYSKALTFEQKPEFYFQRALVLLAKNQIDKAKADLAEVARIKPYFPPTYFIRGLIYYHAADYKNALDDFNAAVQRNPSYYQAIFARGAAKSRLGDNSGSEDDLKQARGMRAHLDDDMQKLGVVP